jgi:hypothetical protein
MTRIREWNQATGHVETLAVVPDYLTDAYVSLVDDHSTDHVIYAVHVDEEAES